MSVLVLEASISETASAKYFSFEIIRFYCKTGSFSWQLSKEDSGRIFQGISRSCPLSPLSLKWITTYRPSWGEVGDLGSYTAWGSWSPDQFTWHIIHPTVEQNVPQCSGTSCLGTSLREIIETQTCWCAEQHADGLPQLSFRFHPVWVCKSWDSICHSSCQPQVASSATVTKLCLLCQTIHSFFIWVPGSLFSCILASSAWTQNAGPSHQLLCRRLTVGVWQFDSGCQSSCCTH